MNPFQWLALSGLALLFARELVSLQNGKLGPRAWALRTAILIAAAATIARPSLVQSLAVSIGIGRGADVVLYGFVLVLIVESFYFYSRTCELRREVTELMRHLALAEARRGESVEEPA
jgi:hypothetical protein